MNSMRANTIKSVLFALFFTVLLGYNCTANAATVNMTITAQEPPITFLACSPETDKGTVSADIGFHVQDGKRYIFLPSCVGMTNVQVRYNGTQSFYDEYTGNLYAPGSEFAITLASGQNYLYEYEQATNTYTRYELYVMKTQNIATMFITLDDGDEALRRINLSKENLETGSMVMLEKDGSVVYNDKLTKVKGRGNSSYTATGELETKNPININLSKKTELIDKAGKSKKWSLIAVRMA